MFENRGHSLAYDTGGKKQENTPWHG